MVKAIQRQTLTSIPLGGSYNGRQAGSYSNCSDSSFAYIDRFGLGVAQPTGSTLTFTFNSTTAA